MSQSPAANDSGVGSPRVHPFPGPCFGHALKALQTSQVAAAKSKLQRVFLTRIKRIDLSKMCVATVVMEGMTGEVDAQEKLIGELAGKFQGFFAGGANGKRGYNLTSPSHTSATS